MEYDAAKHKLATHCQFGAFFTSSDEGCFCVRSEGPKTPLTAPGN